MKLSRLSLLLALAIPSIVAAQTVTVTTPNPVNPSGQPKAVGTTFIVNADGSIASIGGATGTPGTTPPAGATVVAGSDGTNVRTIRTNAAGILLGAPVDQATGTALSISSNFIDATSNGQARLYAQSFGMGFNGTTWDRQRSASAADATTGTGLLGAGILGQYQTTLSTYTNGQFGTLGMDSRGQLRVILGSPDSSGAIATTAPADAAGSTTAVSTRSFDMMFNGTSWDRVRGDTTGGLYTQERERSQFFQDLNGALAAGASGSPIVTRDGGASPSQWGTFSCFARSDQASAASGFAMQASNDNVNFVQTVTSQVAANTPTRITDRNDFRYHRCLFVNGATAATLVTMTSSFGQ